MLAPPRHPIAVHNEANHSEGEIHRRLIEERLVDVMVVGGPNLVRVIPTL
jgi:hypothetical protein